MHDVSERGEPVADVVLDVGGQWCPIPANEAKKALDGMANGEVLAVWTTDPLAPVDLVVLAERLGHRLMDQQEIAGGHWVRIEKRG